MLSPKKTLKQNDCFYCGPWTRSLETIVLSKLEEAMKCGEWVKGEPRSYRKCAKWVRNVIIAEHGLVIPVEAYCSKISEWEVRHCNFKYVKGYRHVLYDNKFNSISVLKSTWAKLLKVMKFIYFYKMLF